MRSTLRRVALTVVAIAAVPGAAAADAVTDWNDEALQAIRAEASPPPVASRALAMMHVAIYDAVNGIVRTHEPLVVRGSVPSSASPEAAAIAAASRVLAALFPERGESLLEFAQQTLAQINNSPHKRQGIAWGERVADEILAWRAADNANASIGPPASVGNSSWVPTPPAYSSYLLPQWGRLVPFAMPTNDAFRPAGPPSLQSDRWAADYAEVQAVGGASSAVRTAEQTAIAFFWADGSGTETPPGHWNRIARAVSAGRSNSLAQNARLFALLNVAMADGAIAAWDAKYVFNFWRPVTAIREGDHDENDHTLKDDDWLPLLPTPPFPEYVSGHSIFSGAAADILARFYGTDRLAFSIPSGADPTVIRSFQSFSDAANDAALSRLYGGIHFPSSIRDGLRAGREIGEWTFLHTMRPTNRRSRCIDPIEVSTPVSWTSRASVTSCQ